MAFPVYKNTDRFPTLDAGEYIAYIEDCYEDTSKKGNKMWVLKFVFEDDIKVTEYITLDQSGAWKMKHLLDALDIPYDGKLEPHQLRGMSVKVQLGREEANGNYPAKNKVEFYLVSDEPLPERKAASTQEPMSVEEQERTGDSGGLPF